MALALSASRSGPNSHPSFLHASSDRQGGPPLSVCLSSLSLSLPPSFSPSSDDDQPPPLVLEGEGEGEEWDCIESWGDLYALKLQLLGPFLFGQQTLSDEVRCHGSWAQ